VVLAALMAGCATAPVRTTPIYPTERIFLHSSYDQVWQATLQALGDHTLLNVQKESGLITTDWTLSKTATKYFGTLLGSYSGPGSEGAEMRYKLNVYVVKTADNETKVRLVNHSEALMPSVLPTSMLNCTQGPGTGLFYCWKPIDTETVIEHQILEQIQASFVNSPSGQSP